MKHIKLLLWAIFACVLICSCDESTQHKKIYTSDISVKKINGMNYAYYQGRPFSGEVLASDKKSMMVIKNGMAVVAYANYGQSGSTSFENQLDIYDDIYTLEQHRANAYYNGTPGQKFVNGVYYELKIRALRSLPNCCFLR